MKIYQLLLYITLLLCVCASVRQGQAQVVSVAPASNTIRTLIGMPTGLRNDVLARQKRPMIKDFFKYHDMVAGVDGISCVGLVEISENYYDNRDGDLVIKIPNIVPMIVHRPRVIVRGGYSQIQGALIPVTEVESENFIVGADRIMISHMKGEGFGGYIEIDRSLFRIVGVEGQIAAIYLDQLDFKEAECATCDNNDWAGSGGMVDKMVSLSRPGSPKSLIAQHVVEGFGDSNDPTQRICIVDVGFGFTGLGFVQTRSKTLQVLIDKQLRSYRLMVTEVAV